MLPGQLAGLVVGVAFCGVLAGLLILENNKITKEVNEAEEKLQKEDKEKLVKAGYEKYEDDKFVIATSYIYKIEPKDEIVVVKGLFYNSFWKQYAPFKAKITKVEFEKRNLKVGDFIKTIHKFDKDRTLTPRKGKEIL